MRKVTVNYSCIHVKLAVGNFPGQQGKRVKKAQDVTYQFVSDEVNHLGLLYRSRRFKFHRFIIHTDPFFNNKKSCVLKTIT